MPDTKKPAADSHPKPEQPTTANDLDDVPSRKTHPDPERPDLKDVEPGSDADAVDSSPSVI